MSGDGHLTLPESRLKLSLRPLFLHSLHAGEFDEAYRTRPHGGLLQVPVEASLTHQRECIRTKHRDVMTPTRRAPAQFINRRASENEDK